MSTSLKRTTFWNFFYTNIRTVIAIANGILIVPLYLHYIPGPLFGAWLATGNVMTWLSIADPGVGDVLLQKVANALGRDDKNEIGLAVSSGFVIATIAFVIISAAGLFGSSYIVNSINYNGNHSNELLRSFQIALIGTCLSMFANTSNNIIIGFQKTKQFGFYSVLINISAILINVVLLLLGAGLYSLAYAFLFRGVAGILYSMVYCIIILKQHQIHFQFSKKYTGSLSSIFLYTFGGKVFNSVSGNIDLVIISKFLGPQSVILLELSRRPIKIATGFVNNISIASLPALSHVFGTEDIQKSKRILIESILVIIWVTGFIIGGFLVFNGILITLWAGAARYFGNLNNLFSCFSFYFLSITFGLSTILYCLGDIKKNNLVAMGRNIIYLLVVFFMVKRFGMTGEIISFLLSIVLLNCSYYPYRIMQLSKFSQSEKGLLIKELIYSLIFLVFCAIFGLLIFIKVGWFLLIIYCILYAMAFSIYYVIIPSALIETVTMRFNLEKQKRKS